MSLSNKFLLYTGLGGRVLYALSRESRKVISDARIYKGRANRCNFSSTQCHESWQSLARGKISLNIED